MGHCRGGTFKATTMPHDTNFMIQIFLHKLVDGRRQLYVNLLRNDVVGFFFLLFTHISAPDVKTMEKINPLMPNVGIWVQLYVPDQVKPLFVFFDIWAL